MITPIEVPVPVDRIVERIVVKEEIVERVVQVPQIIEKIVTVKEQETVIHEIEKIV